MKEWSSQLGAVMAKAGLYPIHTGSNQGIHFKMKVWDSIRTGQTYKEWSCMAFDFPTLENKFLVPLTYTTRKVEQLT